MEFEDASLRLHPDGSVQPDGLAVHHLVGDDVLHQAGELVRVAQPARVGHRLGQEDPHLLRQRGQQRRVEQAGRDRVHADTLNRWDVLSGVSAD